jgi:small subunit ribosomal protein S19e
MASIYDVPQNELIERAAEELKKVKEVQPPAWASFAKTGSSKEMPPSRKDWWHVRAAAVLRKLYKQGPIGVSKLRTYFGGKKNRGMKPEKFYRGSGNIIRKVLQQLEKAGLAAQVEKGVHKGRSITPKGKSLLDKTATQIQKSLPKKEVKKAPAPKPEAKPAAAEPKKEEPKAEPKEEKKNG